LVFDALRKIAERLNDLGIPYAVAGDVALFRHGLRRFTEYLEIAVRKEGLTRIHSERVGIGYVLPNRYSKSIRDANSGVRIAFLTAGDILHAVQGTSISVPQPIAASFESEGIPYIKLANLVELKLASGKCPVIGVQSVS
jgi:hypothetical protein